MTLYPIVQYVNYLTCKFNYINENIRNEIISIEKIVGYTSKMILMISDKRPLSKISLIYQIPCFWRPL